MDEVVAGRVTRDEIASAGAGDAEEFDAFVAASGSRLLRTAYLLTGDRTRRRTSSRTCWCAPGRAGRGSRRPTNRGPTYAGCW